MGKSRAMYMPLARPLAIPLALTILAIGPLLVFLGVSLVVVCSDPGGCRPAPVVPLVALGIGLMLVGGFVLFTALRLKPKAG